MNKTKKIVISILLLLIPALICICKIVPFRIKEEKPVREFTAFFFTQGRILNDHNDIQQLIAEKTGAICTETWLTGQTKEEATAAMLAGERYPDFTNGDAKLYEAGILVPLDDYIERYDNIKAYLPEETWEQLKQPDGHIYWIPQFRVAHDRGRELYHTDEAFWIQTRVLKWAGYPRIKTVEEYFGLLSDYMAANPELSEGRANIPFTILCDDWRYFCLENPPQFLDGYPNDGCCIVDPDTLRVIDYNTTPTAKEYFRMLNENYHKGIVDPESFTQTYGEYLDKLSTGRVLGMVDQWWQFAYDINDVLQQQGLDAQGCNYVPLPVTMKDGVQNQWHVRMEDTLDISQGLSVTTDCQDMEEALAFVNDLLSDDVQFLRYWGVEGEDYQIDENGSFYRTQSQRARTSDEELQSTHFCIYSYFPHYQEMSTDGINAYSPEYQLSEFKASLPSDIRECFDAYGCDTYVDMLGSNEKPGDWFPMHSYTTGLNYSTPEGSVWMEMTSVKHTYLPQVVMTDDFEDVWKEYMEAYHDCDPQLLFGAMEREVRRRASSGSYSL